MQTKMDAQGTVRLDLELTPDDRRLAARIAQDEGRQHAERLASPQGLASLFPTNRLRWRSTGRQVTVKNGRASLG